jgi:2-iminobutanoate/2-iminopropanoate deaminase
MARKEINAQDAVAVGPYSHGIDADGLIFLSGQTPIDPKTGKLAEGDILKCKRNKALKICLVC